MAEKYRKHCPIRHIDLFILKKEDGTFAVKCSSLKACGQECPFLKDPDYKMPFRRAPSYKPPPKS